MKKINPEDFPFGKVMESFTPEQLEERVRKAHNWEMDKLTMMPYVGNVDEDVKYIYPELTALCPVTGIQDLYTLTITYTPNKSVPELKSLKYYLMGYRDLPIGHESLAAKLYKDFLQQVQPKRLNVELDVAVRGGITTIIKV
jgi:7-cyano-7-deazaguanine reductase